MRFMTAILLVMVLVAFTADANCADRKRDFGSRNMKHWHSLFLNFHAYEPDDAQTVPGSHIDGIIVSGGYGYFNTDRSMIGISYGQFSESEDMQDIEVNPLLVEYTWFPVHHSKPHRYWDIYVGVGIGTFNVDWEPLQNNVSYSDSDMGYMFKLGWLWHMSEHSALSLEGRYYNADVNDVVPANIGVADRDIDVSDWQFGGGIHFFFD